MLVGCYTLDCYCDCDNPLHEWREFPRQFTGETRAECLRSARAHGWVFLKDGQAKCPKCRSLPATRERMYDAAQDRYLLAQ